MINFDDYTNEKYNRTQFKITLYSRSSIQNTYYRWFLDQEKTNALLNLINNQPGIDKNIFYMQKIYMKKKYQYLINKREKSRIKSF